MKVSINTKTAGDGLWSSERRNVRIYKLELNISHDSFGELKAFFIQKMWNTSKLGLIYTDEGWLHDFRKGLIKKGFSAKAVLDVEYSEQGMQGKNYVSMDIGKVFISEARKIFKV